MGGLEIVLNHKKDFKKQKNKFIMGFTSKMK